jgi:phage FluMu protein Com
MVVLRCARCHRRIRIGEVYFIDKLLKNTIYCRDCKKILLEEYGKRGFDKIFEGRIYIE